MPAAAAPGALRSAASPACDPPLRPGHSGRPSRVRAPTIGAAIRGATRRPPTARRGAVPAALALAVALAWGGPAAAAEPATPRGWLLSALDRLCPAGALPGDAAARRLPGARLLDERRRGPAGERATPTQAVVLEQVFALPGGGELRSLRLQPGGQLRRFVAEYHAATDGAPRPLLQAVADGACRPLGGRRLVYAEGRPQALEQLAGDLATLRRRQTLDAPWPPGRDPGGPRVALVDSGLAYDLPQVRDRLARDAAGRPLGYDFWDLDPRPYDADFSRGPFRPIRHGTGVASVLLREAPTAALIPYRYPRPDMDRLAALVARAAAAGARILALPLGSRDAADWQAFATALRAHPELLAIASAGNDGRDLEAAPLWPAALDLPNLVVVTSATPSGRLAPGSNWGARSVDLLVPAEEVAIFDARGAPGRASGSSYAVPRVAALAARLLARDPALATAALKTALFARARPAPQAAPVVAVGWIPDPAAELMPAD